MWAKREAKMTAISPPGSRWPGLSWRPCRPGSLAAAGLLALSLLAGCGSGAGKVSSAPGSVQEGEASYYAHRFHGRPTASGEIYDENAMTAAHKSLAFGTRVRVTNRSNGKKVTVRINDRGPFVAGRIIDLSYRAAGELDMITAGVVPVRVEVLNTAGDF